jgi:predicted lipid-binding transport protein (Tim44 family)
MDPSNSALDLVLLAVIAIVGWKLWKVLGTRTGFERTPDTIAPVEPTRSEPVMSENLPPIWQDHAKEGSELANTLVEMSKIDPGLNLGNFISGAKIFHTQVLEAFSSGNLKDVVPFMARDVYEALNAEAIGRKRRAETLHYKLVGYDSARIVSATLNGTIAALKTRFETRLISWTTDAAGKTVFGSSSKIESHIDQWTFERDLTSQQPNWALVETDEAKDEE